MHYDDISFDKDAAFHKTTGELLAPEVQKMSKSKGNVISPDMMIDKYGADTLRVYSMFLGPWNEMSLFDVSSIEGSSRFLKKVFALSERALSDADNPAIAKIIAQTVLKVSHDIEHFQFNTAVSQLMILTNAMQTELPSSHQFSILVKLLAPFAPHLAEELWQKLGNDQSIFKSLWPVAKQAEALEETVEVVIQINGKVRGRITVPRGLKKEDLEREARDDQKVSQYLRSAASKDVVVVPDRLVNFVT